MTIPITTVPESVALHRSRRTLRDIALSHSRSRVLSYSTRRAFAQIAGGDPVESNLEEAFFEAALSTATRGAHSMARRRDGADLNALREAVLRGEDIAGVKATVIVNVHAKDAEAIARLVDTLGAHLADGVTVDNVDAVMLP